MGVSRGTLTPRQRDVASESDALKVFWQQVATIVRRDVTIHVAIIDR